MKIFIKNLSFSSFSSVKKNEDYVPPVAFVKSIFLCLLIFGSIQNFLRSYYKLKSNIKKWNFGIGVLQTFGTTWKVSKIFLNITPPYQPAQLKTKKAFALKTKKYLPIRQALQNWTQIQPTVGETICDCFNVNIYVFFYEQQKKNEHIPDFRLKWL